MRLEESGGAAIAKLKVATCSVQQRTRPFTFSSLHSCYTLLNSIYIYSTLLLFYLSSDCDCAKWQLQWTGIGKPAVSLSLVSLSSVVSQKWDGRHGAQSTSFIFPFILHAQTNMESYSFIYSFLLFHIAPCLTLLN